MTRLLVISSRVESDLAEAVAWYKIVGFGPDNHLLVRFEEALGRILERPEAYPVTLPGVRRALVSRFPYGIFFQTAANRIEVEALFHLRAGRTRLTNRFVTRSG